MKGYIKAINCSLIFKSMFVSILQLLLRDFYQNMHTVHRTITSMRIF
jgi:hypothetical protein